MSFNQPDAPTPPTPAATTPPDPQPERPEPTKPRSDVAQLQANMEQMAARLDQLISEKEAAESSKKTAAQQLEELHGQINTLRQQQTDAQLTALAANAGARNPSIVAAQIRNAQDPAAALEALRQSDAYLFATSAPSPDGGGDTPTPSSDDPLTAHLLGAYGLKT